MAKNVDNDSPEVNIITNGTQVKGEISASGDIRIDGILIGSVTSRGKVVVGITGSVEGDIKCQHADIAGKVNATVVVAELLALKASANLSGEISIGKISIEPGAKFTGKCVMNNQTKPVQNTPALDEKAI